MDQKNLIVAALLSVIVLVGWGLLFPPSERTPPPVNRAEVVPLDPLQPRTADPVPLRPLAADPAAPQQLAEVTLEAEPVFETLEREVVIETDSVIARFTNRGGQMTSLVLKGVIDRNGELLEMVRRRAAGPYPFALVGSDGGSLPINDALFVIDSSTELRGRRNVRFRYRGPEGAVVKEFNFLDDGLFDIEVTFEGRQDWGLMMGPGVRNPTAAETEKSYYSYSGATYFDGNDVESLSAVKGREPILLPGASIRWVGVEDTYFMASLLPRGPLQQVVLQPMLATEWSETQPALFVPRPSPERLSDEQKKLPVEYRVLLQPGRDTLSVQAFWGPKSYVDLAALPGNLGLEQAIRWQWFGVLARPMLYVMLWIHDNVVANYGWSIVLLTLLIKILLSPLTHKSYVSSRKMQAVQPKMQAIKHKYRAKLKDKKGRPNLDMQRKQNEEIQALFKQEGVNPAAGCLPLLLQMPFFFSFFTLLRNMAELYNAPWMLWIQDLSAKDPYFVLPIVMGASQFLQQRLIGTGAMEPSQRMMMNLMPLMFMFFFISAPSGLVLYWVTSNLVTIVQQLVLKRFKASGLFGGDDSAAAASKKLAPTKKK